MPKTDMKKRIKICKEVFMLEKDKLYISFHRPKSIVGFLISTWTLGKYSHCEFIYNNQVFLSNPGGVRTRKFEYQKNMEIYELDKNIDPKDVIEFFRTAQGRGYDYLGILGQFFYADKVQDDNRFFCSEFCLNAIDYALQFTLTYKGKSLKDRVGYQFSPAKLYKYLKNMFIYILFFSILFLIKSIKFNSQKNI